MKKEGQAKDGKPGGKPGILRHGLPFPYRVMGTNNT